MPPKNRYMKLFHSSLRRLAILSAGLFSLTTQSSCGDDDSPSSSSVSKPTDPYPGANPAMLELLLDQDGFTFPYLRSNIYRIHHVSETTPVPFQVGDVIIESLGVYQLTEAGFEAVEAGMGTVYDQSDVTNTHMVNFTSSTKPAPVLFEGNRFTITLHYSDIYISTGALFYAPDVVTLSFVFDEDARVFTLDSARSSVTYGTQIVYLTCDPISAPPAPPVEIP